MLNPISVSLNKVQTPKLFDNKYQTNPFALKTLQSDTFTPSQSVANVSFTSVDNSIVGKSIRELGDVPCPYCGTRIINGKEINHLNKENLGGRSDKAIKLLQPFEDRMHPVEKEVFGILKDLSKDKPEKNLRELLDTVRPEHLKKVQDAEQKILHRMFKCAKTIQNKEDAKNVGKLLASSKEILEKQDPNYIFRRRRLLEKLNNVTKNMNEQHKAQELLNIAEDIPRSHDNVSAFIVKFTQKDAGTKQEKTPFQIGISLVEPSVGSLEHITPRHPQDGSEGGKNIYSNYVYASKEWNTRRKNMPLDKWVDKNPEIKDHMQNYIDAVIEKINKKEALQRCRVYPILVAETVEKESKGKIKLDTSKLKLSKRQIAQEMSRVKKQEAEIVSKAQKKEQYNKKTKGTQNKKLSVFA